ncbi:YjzD family protein [Lentibacillus sp. L22]|uniref:YjzD family protein n=1 Tax=Lentibacillus TaxID=175304 RepID=UPI0022B2199E|nr:YjzD family protein [Lentibacillus daqui]
MRFFWTFIWALAIGGVISYILSAMAGEPFNVIHTLVLSIIFTIAIYVLGEGILKEQAE